jgi:hypothetical protein
VASEEFQHVIEEANPGGDFIPSVAFDRKLDGDARFGGVAVDNCMAE